MKYTIVLTADFPPVARDMLAGEFDVIEHPTEHGRTEEDMITLLADADGAITLLSDPVTHRVFESNPNLRVVANFAVGYNNIDTDAARAAGVRVTNTPGVLTEATADLTLGLMLAATRRIVEADDHLRTTKRCEWEPLLLLGASLQQKTLGIIGFGRIGQAVAKRAVAFGLDVIYTSRSTVESQLGRQVALPELLETSDIISIHAPLTRDTRHVIDAAALQRMKRGSYLVNTARGALVDEGALCEALMSGHLAGAALDVYEHEPVVDPRLFRLPNVVLAPHIGSATIEARSAMARIAATEVLRFFRGLPPLHAVV